MLFKNGHMEKVSQIMMNGCLIHDRMIEVNVIKLVYR
jgi:hypothetical protein